MRDRALFGKLQMFTKILWNFSQNEKTICAEMYKAIRVRVAPAQNDT